MQRFTDDSKRLEDFLQKYGFTAANFFAALKKIGLTMHKTKRSRPEIIDDRFMKVREMGADTRSELHAPANAPGLTYVYYGDSYGVWIETYKSQGQDKPLLRVHGIAHITGLGATDLEHRGKGHGPDADESRND